MSDNLYRRGEIWWARVQVRGREIRRSLRTTSRTEARKRLATVLADSEHFRFHGENRHTWKDAVVQWSMTPGVKQSVVDRYLCSFRSLRAVLDDLYVDEISKSTMAKIGRRPGVTNATKRRDLTAVSAVLSWCVANEWAEENVAKTWDRSVIRERRDPIQLPLHPDIDLVVLMAPGNFARLIRLAHQTGMRQEEIAGLQWSAVDTKRQAVNLAKTKTNKNRSVPLSDSAVGTLLGTPRYLGSPWVFWHGEGERYGNVPSQFGALCRRIIAHCKKEKIEFQRFRFHDLRHLFAVEYLRSGTGSIYDLQKILGHSSITATEIYLDFLTPQERDLSKGTAQKPAQV